MPHSIFFTKGEAIHGFTDTPFGVAAVSHGCVRLPPSYATALYQLVKEQGMPNTTIVVRGRIPRRPLVAQRGQSMQEADSYAGQGYGQPGYRDYWNQGYGQPPAYSRSGYGSYGQRTLPPQPGPVYYSGQSNYNGGGRAYYQQPYGGY